MEIALENVIAFKYIVRDAETGEVYENTYGQKPMEFLVGSGKILPALEKELIRLQPGEQTKIVLKEPYGEYIEENIMEVPLYQVGDIPLEEGMILYAKGKNGEALQVKVKSFDAEKVFIDHNHPLAGKDLEFKLKVTSKRQATPEEMQHGHIHPAEKEGGCGCGCH